MSAKRYWPKLVTLLTIVCVYIARYRKQIEDALGEGSSTALDGIMLACDVFIALTPSNQGD